MGGKPRKKPSPEVEMTRIIQADALNELANAAARKFVEITSEPPRHIPVGVNSIRTKREAMEQAYAHQWIIENNPAKSNTILEMIISKENRPAILTQRDWDVASTVIQWLGSTVGQAFTKDVIQRYINTPVKKGW